MLIFKTKAFNSWVKDNGLTDDQLRQAINEIGNGLYEASLGGKIFKKRVALGGRGKSGGARTIVAFRAAKHAFFLYGYSKNVRSNISTQEEGALRKLARIYFGFSDDQLTRAVESGELIEVV